nr:alkaline phosphatase family protein [Leucobacter exalbidus]
MANDAPATQLTPKTLVIGVDGASFDVMAQANMPNVKALQAGGLTAASNLPASPMAQTVSGAGWSTIATGVWPDKHGVPDNSFSNPHYDQYPDYLTRVEQNLPDRATFVAGTWGPIATTIFGGGVDTRVEGGNDEGTTARVVEQLTTGQPDDIFVHLDEVDGVGHGYGSSSAEYLVALDRADAQIGEMVAAVKERPTYANEDWLIVVTADHGHKPTGGHGGPTKLERKTHVIAQGTGMTPGLVRDDVKITDIAPIVLGHVGIANDPTWDLDGLTVDQIIPDDFDTLRPVLQTAVTETGPERLLGWTNQAPEGWSVDNSKMPTGGTPEFHGWTFMTDDFFSNVELGQNRENNVRSRNVFAVADSDEWDDAGDKSSNKFDSTLVTPAYELNGASTVDVSFVSDYAVDGPQGATVWAYFDEESGAQRQKLIEYPADGTRENPVNKIERLAIELPRGENGQLPKTVSLQFSYAGVNSAFWAIDQVRVTQPDAPIPAELTLSASEVAAGDTINISGTGFTAEEALRVELRSTVQHLADLSAGLDGSIGADIEIPAATEAGDHTLVVVRADGSEVQQPLTVTAAQGTADAAGAEADAQGAADGAGAEADAQGGAGAAGAEAEGAAQGAEADAQGAADAAGSVADGSGTAAADAKQAEANATGSAQGDKPADTTKPGDTVKPGDTGAKLAATGQAASMGIFAAIAAAIVAAGTGLVFFARRRRNA